MKPIRDINSNKGERYFRTESFYLSAFLFAKGLELANIDSTIDPKRSQFIFIDTPEREILTQNYSFSREDSPGVMIDARKFATAIKALKDKLYQSNNYGQSTTN